MSELQCLLRHSTLLLWSITINLLYHYPTLADNTKPIQIKKDIDIVHTRSGGVRIGLTLQQYRVGLKRQEREAEVRFIKALPNERQHIETQLQTIQSQLQNIRQSYHVHIEDLIKRISQLESVRGEVSDELLSQTQQALANDDAQQVNLLLQQMETQTANADNVTAESNYQRCQIYKSKMRYRQAFNLCQRAVKFAPHRTDYLSELADLAHAMGEHEKAITYYEQALDRYLETYGENHPGVAISRNNLGTTWDSLGKYEKAIGYYEQALASDLKTYGNDHPDVAIGHNNLGMAWHALGEYNKAIFFLEQALISDLKTYGEDHIQVATYQNNLAGAWHALGEYNKASNHLNQALASFEKILGANHPKTSSVRENYRQLLADIQNNNNKSNAKN